MINEASTANVVLEDDYPMVLVGRDHRISYANTRAHQLLGYKQGGLHGSSIEQLLAPSRRAEVRNVQAVFRGQAALRFRSVARKADGQLLDVTLGLEPCLDHLGGVVAVKLRCELLARTPSPSLPPFGGGSGTRTIPPKSGERNVAVRSVPPPPPPSARTVSARPPTPSAPPPTPSARPQPLRSVAPPKPSPERELVLSDDGAEQLETALQLLAWVRQRIQSADGPIDDPRERARALIVLGEAADLVAECRCESRRELKSQPPRS